MNPFAIILTIISGEANEAWPADNDGPTQAYTRSRRNKPLPLDKSRKVPTQLQDPEVWYSELITFATDTSLLVSLFGIPALDNHVPCINVSSQAALDRYLSRFVLLQANLSLIRCYLLGRQETYLHTRASCFHKAVQARNLQVQNAKVPVVATVRRTPCSLQIKGVGRLCDNVSRENTDTSRQKDEQSWSAKNGDETRGVWDLGQPLFVAIVIIQSDKETEQ